jgi:hypothetical protein
MMKASHAKCRRATFVVCAPKACCAVLLPCCPAVLQSQVGTVVRTGEDEDPIAVMTVLNTQQHSKAAYMQQIKQHMLAHCKDAAVKEQLTKVCAGCPGSYKGVQVAPV